MYREISTSDKKKKERNFGIWTDQREKNTRGKCRDFLMRQRDVVQKPAGAVAGGECRVETGRERERESRK